MKDKYGISFIEFIDPPKPLSILKNNIRAKLEWYQSYPCDPSTDSIRYSEMVTVTAGTGVLLDSLVIPYYRIMRERIKERIDSSYDSLSIEDDSDTTCFEMMGFECVDMIENLIEWRRMANGDIVFLTDEGDVLPLEIGVKIAKSDLDDFFQIVDRQTDDDIDPRKVGLLNPWWPNLVGI